MKKLTQLSFVLFFCFQVQAQQKTISGIVSDENGLPLPGATVLIKGTTTGTQTGFDGNYTLQANVGDIITFTYVGYKTQEQTVGTSNTINVSLQPDNSLEEVVVTAYSTTTKEAYTGSAHITIRGSGSVKGSSYNIPSGILTAGEINDIEKWKDWVKLLKTSNFCRTQNNWGFFLENKIIVELVDLNSKPLVNIPVTIYTENNHILMKSKTDAFGKVVLFKDSKISDHNNYYYRIQAKHNNKVFGRKITGTMEYQKITIDTYTNQMTNAIDVMFTIDSTGSMDDEMNYLKAELENIFNQLNDKLDIKRLALTFYRDHGDDYLVRDFDFNSDISKMQDILRIQKANGGGDYEEAVEKALAVSIAKEWNPNAKARLLFLLLDAPPHYTSENVRIIKNQIQLAQEKGIKIIPIVASGANKDVEFLMRFFSVSTNGTYVFLTDDSGIGNPHLKPTTDSFSVEKLNALIVRLIEKYANAS